MWFVETNDGERIPATQPHRVQTPAGDYVLFCTLDQLGRPTPRLASWPSMILASEMGGRLVRD
jgi:hypothetical protein